MKRVAKTPRVLERLYAEHRYLSALLRVLEDKTGARARLKTGDYYLLRDIVGYVHDYPDHVHHPTEDLLFEQVLRKDPAQHQIVERLRRDHQQIQAETRQLLTRLDALIDRPNATRARVLWDACRSLARHQRAHMQLENREAFPAAIAVLSHADWQKIETRFLTAEDPLFGDVVSSRHRLLYEYLLDYADGSDFWSAIARLFSVDRLVRIGRILASGAADGWQRLAKPPPAQRAMLPAPARSSRSKKP
jgi:hemerythrin-like domain-containing protein